MSHTITDTNTNTNADADAATGFMQSTAGFFNLSFFRLRAGSGRDRRGLH